MEDRDETGKQLVSELSELRQRVAELEAAEAERKRSEEALKESEEKLRLIFENAFDGISIYEELLDSEARRLLDCNERYTEMSGRSKQELLKIQNTSLIQRRLGPSRSKEENLRIRREKLSYKGLFSWVRPSLSR